jgi:hypothetical protein
MASEIQTALAAPIVKTASGKLRGWRTGDDAERATMIFDNECKAVGDPRPRGTSGVSGQWWRIEFAFLTA